MQQIPKNKVLSEKKVGTKIVSVKRKYVSSLNQICNLDSNYEYDYALYLDYLYEKGEIAGWVRNTTKFYFSRTVEIPGRTTKQNAYRPDFIIFNKDSTYQIHEVKGWMNDKSQVVCDQFAKDYPNLTYKIITRDEILSLQSQFKDKIWGWEKIK